MLPCPSPNWASPMRFHRPIEERASLVRDLQEQPCEPSWKRLKWPSSYSVRKCYVTSALTATLLALSLSSCSQSDDSEAPSSGGQVETQSNDLDESASATGDEQTQEATPTDDSEGEVVGRATVVATDEEGFKLRYQFTFHEVQDHVDGDALDSECLAEPLSGSNDFDIGQALDSGRYDVVKVQTIDVMTRDVTPGNFQFQGVQYLGTGQDVEIGPVSCSGGTVTGLGNPIKPAIGETTQIALVWLGSSTPKNPDGFSGEAPPWSDYYLQVWLADCVAHSDGIAVSDDGCQLTPNADS